MMKERRSTIIGTTVGLLVVCAAGSLVIEPWANGRNLDRRAKAQQGRSKEEALQALGSPGRRYSPASYSADRKNIAHSYNPDPPAFVCDEVLSYSEGTRLALLFVRDGRVVHVYSGLT